MDYNHINNFLDKFKKLLFKGEEVNKIIAEVLTKHLKTPIDIGMIQVKSTTIYVKCSPILHNEVLVHKQAILSDLVSLLPERRFSDIR